MNKKDCDEANAVEHAQTGDREAFAELYRRHRDAIYRYIYHRVKDQHVAEDLTAEVFVKAMEGLPDYRAGDTPLLAWLYRIARARAVDHWRKMQRRQETQLTATLPARSPDPETLVDTWLRWDAILDVLTELTPDQQQVVILRYVEGLNLKAVAEITGKSVGAIKALQSRAVASLARLLE